jgi:capsular exopolysaccharide synthesis family protein
MSRLFEALNDAEIKRGALKIIPRAVASPSAAQPDAISPSETPEVPPQAMEPANRVSASIPGTVALPETVSPGMISPEGSSTVPAEEIEKENPPLHESAWKFVSPAVAPRSAAAVVSAPPESTHLAEQLTELPANQINIPEAHSVHARVSPDSRLVAFANPNSMGAEKFRALVTRLDHLRRHKEMKSFQVTSSVINEGKTLVAGNLAVTLAKYSGSKTLLIEGDLHRPTLATLFGLSELPGLSDWWSGSDPEPTEFVYKLNDMPLWILPAGKSFNRPSDILSSARFAKAYAELAGQFEWIVVDSTPMLPIVDANLWSRLVDGTLLVVREGLAPVKALKEGLQALDQPKLIGVVINDVSGTDHINYDDRYYSAGKPTTGPVEKT